VYTKTLILSQQMLLIVSRLRKGSLAQQVRAQREDIKHQRVGKRAGIPVGTPLV